jgi:hypothetical protein
VLLLILFLLIQLLLLLGNFLTECGTALDGTKRGIVSKKLRFRAWEVPGACGDSFTGCVGRARPEVVLPYSLLLADQVKGEADPRGLSDYSSKLHQIVATLSHKDGLRTHKGLGGLREVQRIACGAPTEERCTSFRDVRSTLWWACLIQAHPRPVSCASIDVMQR